MQQTEEKSDQGNTEETLKKELVELQDKIDSLTGLSGLSDDDETLIKVINIHINTFAFGVYRTLGVTDGRIGTRDFQILKTAKMQAAWIADLVKSKLSGRVAALTYSVNEKEAMILKVKSRMEDTATTLKEIEEDENDDDKQFSLFQGWLCIIFGLLMIASDIVVSLNLVIFFGVGNEHSVNGVNDGLLAKVMDAELLLFSLGIAFCTILVKILYDDYVNTKFGFWEKEKNKIVRRIGQISKGALSFEYYIKLIVKILILVGLLAFLYYLAKYRTYFTIQSVEQISSIFNASDNISNIILNCFIGLSVIIPVVSGIALSVGFRVLGRRRMMRKAVEKHQAENKNYDEFYKQLFQAKSKVQELATFHSEWMGGEGKVDAISELFSNNYNQGFRQGYALKFGNDFYGLIENYRNEIVNISMNQKINKYLS